MEQYTVTGMSCAACQARVEKAVSGLPGVTSCSVSLLTNSMGVEGNVDSKTVIKAVEDAGYGAFLRGNQKKSTAADNEDALIDRETPKLKKRLITSLGFLIALMYITMGVHMLNLPLPKFLNHNHLALTLTQMLLAIIVMIINSRFFVSGFKSLWHRAPNMDTLVALGSSVSFAWSTFVFYQMCSIIASGGTNHDLMEIYHNQLYFESAAMIPAFITVGKMLEALSKGRTTSALKNLMKLAPKTAVLLVDGQEKEVSIDEVSIGDIFVVRPGDSIPVDGIIIEGNSAINESALTGESIPVDKSVDDKVSAATINQSGYLKCRATRVGEDTTLAQIIQMVSDAATTKAPIARIADKVSGVFVPAVMAISLIVLIGWLLAGRDFTFALARAISVLVIACPCALGLATPVAIMVGNGLGAKNGILFKTSEALENLGRAQIIALDKTGTITSGQPVVTDIIPVSADRNQLLEIAYGLEAPSEHPLAKAIVDYAAGNSVVLRQISNFKALSGSGVQGEYETHQYIAGNLKFISQHISIDETTAGKAQSLSEEGKTPLFFADEQNLLGIIAVADEIKSDSKEAISQLKNLGLKVVMLTGDNARTARAIADKAGVDQVISDVLPDGKEAQIRSLAAEGKVIMVGDGINDAPALVRADTGIAIGAGTDVAIDSADIVLMNSRLTDVSAAIRLSRATVRNIHENLFWAFFYNLICIPLAAGLFRYEMNPMLGAAAMSLSSFTVCTNALRLNLFKLHDPSHDKPLRNMKSVDKPAEKQQEIKTAQLMVEGMMCEHCEMRVAKALTALDFITEARADHTSGLVTVSYENELDAAAIAKAISDADYEYKGIKGKDDMKMEKTLRVEGMMCEHCEMTVRKALEAVDGVAKAEVSHVEGTAKVTLEKEVADEVLTQAVEAKDYKVLGVE
ncbi:MAG: heavy metal translocating P-type ATPase [Erysipelotrichaceae bacterium]|nr:heavy metal translocating P-type ATPase [Erysipelotrichaceae bacterium]